MSASHVAIAVAAPAQSRAINPVEKRAPLSVSYDVRGLESTYLCNSCPSASHQHQGNGWTRITVATREEPALLLHLQALFMYAYRKVGIDGEVTDVHPIFGV